MATAETDSNNLVSLIKLSIFTHLVFLKTSWNLTNLHRLKINYSAEKCKHCLRDNLMSTETTYNDYQLTQLAAL